MDLKDYIRSIPDYPKKGILFRDITTLIKNEKAFSECIDQIVELGYDPNNLDWNIIYIDERGDVSVAVKGCKAIQNMVLATYDHHNQMYPCFFDHTIDIDITSQIISIAKFILMRSTRITTTIQYGHWISRIFLFCYVLKQRSFRRM